MIRAIERQSWWKQSLPAAARRASAIGIGSGLIAGLIDGVLAPRDFSLGSLLAFGLFGGITGFSFWLWLDSERGAVLRTFMKVLGGVIFVVLLALGFWH